MSMIRRALPCAVIAAVAASLAACGAGGSGGTPVSVVLPPVTGPQPRITTSFGTTVVDHYPLDAQRKKPEPPELPDDPEFPDELRQAILADYHALLEEYEAGNCCWEMVADESDIASREDVLAKLRENAYEFEFAGRHPRSRYIRGHRSPPVVRFNIGTPLEARAATLRAIDNINAWLPWERHVTVGNDADLHALEVANREALSRLSLRYSELFVWDSVIWEANFGDPSQVVDTANQQVGRAIEEFSAPEIVAATNAAAEVAAIYNSNRNSPAQLLNALQTAYDEAQLKTSQAWEDIRAAEDARFPDNVINARFGLEGHSCGQGNFHRIHIREGCGTTVIIQHELLHALGLDGGRSCYEKFGLDCDNNSSGGPMYYYSHVPVSKFPESTMAYASPYDDTHGLSQIDGETLQTIYNREHLWEHRSQDRYSDEFTIADVSPEELGEWDDAVVRYEGRFGQDLWLDSYGFVQPSFGVDWRNGIARPWADGETTHGTFAESGLSGSATWNGELVGFTPRQEAVHGDSAIQVELADLIGSAAFTALEYWNAGAPPGGGGTGMQWGDGDLHYSIKLDGNHLRSTAGDEGYVSGRFVGEHHESAVGILEHPDLAAGWGALR